MKKPPETIAPFVEACRAYVERAVGVALDGSTTSLAFVDHYVQHTRAGGPVKDEVLALVAPALGAYLGEVAIAQLGGRWTVAGEDPAAWRIELGTAPLWFHPVGMAAEALRQGDVEGYDASFSTIPAFQEALEEALAASPPVDEAYYYSLTGRLEVLEQAIDVLTELERRRRENAS